MRNFMFLAVAAAIAVATPAPAQSIPAVPPVIPAPQEWIDIPALAPAVTDRETRAQMNREIVRAIMDADGDQAMARNAIVAIVARYQENALPQSARMRPGPK